MSTGVVLLAAGSGNRFGGRTPKQFLPFHGRPLFAASLSVFASVPSVTDIALVVPPGRAAAVRRRLPRLPRRIRVSIVDGGSFRGESVKYGVEALGAGCRVILIHDAARPLVTADIVRRVERAAAKTGAALAAWPLADTLKKDNGRSMVANTVARAGLWLAQTPQGFRRDVAALLLSPTPGATDDVGLVEAHGLPVELVQGSPTNIKVTTPHDLRICRALR